MRLMQLRKRLAGTDLNPEERREIQQAITELENDLEV